MDSLELDVISKLNHTFLFNLKMRSFQQFQNQDTLNVYQFLFRVYDPSWLLKQDKPTPVILKQIQNYLHRMELGYLTSKGDDLLDSRKLCRLFGAVITKLESRYNGKALGAAVRKVKNQKVKPLPEKPKSTEKSPAGSSRNSSGDPGESSEPEIARVIPNKGREIPRTPDTGLKGTPSGDQTFIMPPVKTETNDQTRTFQPILPTREIPRTPLKDAKLPKQVRPGHRNLDLTYDFSPLASKASTPYSNPKPQHSDATYVLPAAPAGVDGGSSIGSDSVFSPPVSEESRGTFPARGRNELRQPEPSPESNRVGQAEVPRQDQAFDPTPDRDKINAGKRKGFRILSADTPQAHPKAQPQEPKATKKQTGRKTVREAPKQPEAGSNQNVASEKEPPGSQAPSQGPPEPTGTGRDSARATRGKSEPEEPGTGPRKKTRAGKVQPAFHGPQDVPQVPERAGVGVDKPGKKRRGKVPDNLPVLERPEAGGGDQKENLERLEPTEGSQTHWVVPGPKRGRQRRERKQEDVPGEADLPGGHLEHLEQEREEVASLTDVVPDAKRGRRKKEPEADLFQIREPRVPEQLEHWAAELEVAQVAKKYGRNRKKVPVAPRADVPGESDLDRGSRTGNSSILEHQKPKGRGRKGQNATESLSDATVPDVPGVPAKKSGRTRKDPDESSRTESDPVSSSGPVKKRRNQSVPEADPVVPESKIPRGRKRKQVPKVSDARLEHDPVPGDQDGETGTPDEPVGDSRVPGSKKSRVKCSSSALAPDTSVPDQILEPKKGRGRPKKVPEPAEPPGTFQAPSEERESQEVSVPGRAIPVSKKGRGRPKRVPATDGDERVPEVKTTRGRRKAGQEVLERLEHEQEPVVPEVKKSRKGRSKTAVQVDVPEPDVQDQDGSHKSGSRKAAADPGTRGRRKMAAGTPQFVQVISGKESTGQSPVPEHSGKRIRLFNGNSGTSGRE